MEAFYASEDGAHEIDGLVTVFASGLRRLYNFNSGIIFTDNEAVRGAINSGTSSCSANSFHNEVHEPTHSPSLSASSCSANS